MSVARGCEFPEDLQYHIEHNIWVRLEDDGSITIGMTSYGASLAGKVVAFTPKKVGKNLKKDKSCATVESGKWVGPAKVPVAGEIVEINDVVLNSPELINTDPYGEGWLVRLKPWDWQGESVDLLSGEEARLAFEKKMTSEGFEGCN